MGFFAVIDTNVLVSALITKSETAATVLVDLVTGTLNIFLRGR